MIILKEESIMIATLNKSKTALTINRQEFKLALEKIGAGIDKQIASLKKAIIMLSSFRIIIAWESGLTLA
jgi:hypothetical protein